MEFKVSELEREPIDFDLELAPGVVDLGEEATQVGALPSRVLSPLALSNVRRIFAPSMAKAL